MIFPLFIKPQVKAYHKNKSASKMYVRSSFMYETERNNILCFKCIILKEKYTPKQCTDLKFSQM